MHLYNFLKFLVFSTMNVVTMKFIALSEQVSFVFHAVPYDEFISNIQQHLVFGQTYRETMQIQ